MIAAYEDMPEDLKNRIEGKILIHDSRTTVRQLRKGHEEVSDPSKHQVQNIQ